MYTATSSIRAQEADTLTLYDLASRMGVSYSTIYELARRDELPVPVIRVGRRYLVSRKAYEAVMSAQHRRAPERGQQCGTGVDGHRL